MPPSLGPYDRLTFAGRVWSAKRGLGGARITLVDQRGGEAVASILTGHEGQYRLTVSYAEEPELFQRLLSGRITVVAEGKDGQEIGRRRAPSRQLGRSTIADLRVTRSDAERFKPIVPPLDRVRGRVIDPRGLDELDLAISHLASPGQPQHRALSRASRCPLPPIDVFDTLLDDAWGVLDGDPTAERSFVTALGMLAGDGTGTHGLPMKALDEVLTRQGGKWSRDGQRRGGRLPAGAGTMPPMVGRLGDLTEPVPCLLAPERILPLYAAAFRLSPTPADAHRLVGAIEHGLCGLGRMDALLGAARHGLGTGDFGGLKGMLEHLSGECGPDDGPVPGGRLPGGPCPDEPFPDLFPDPCELKRRDCLVEMGEIGGHLANPGPPYSVSAMDPLDACPGDTIVITGINFGSTPGKVCFRHGTTGVAQMCVDADDWSDTRIEVTVPDYAGRGNLHLRIVDTVLPLCNSAITINRRGAGNRYFAGGEATISSLRVDGQGGEVCYEPGARTATIQWSATKGGDGTTVRLQVRLNGVVIIDQAGLPDVGTMPLDVPDSGVELRYLIWAEATNSCGSDSKTLDLIITNPSQLSLEGMEVTQATQAYDSDQHLPAGIDRPTNSVTLVTDRRTLVRVYVDSGLDGFDLGSGDGVVTGVSAVLHGSHDGAPLPGSPLDPLNGPIAAYRNAPYADTRGGWDRTLNFELPRSWADGAVTLRAVATPLGKRAFGTEETSADVTFVEARPLKLVGVRIRYTGKGTNAAGGTVNVDIAAPPFAALVTAAAWLRRTYPVNDIDFFDAPGNEVIEFDGDLTDGSGPGCGTEWGDLMNAIRDLASEYDEDDDAVWVGLLPTGWSGAAWGGCGGTASGAVGAAVIFANDTGPVLAQEAGHGYGRGHAPGCGAGGPDPSYPVYGYGSTASIGEYGVDIPAPGITEWIIQDPNTRNDFMGYCGSAWVSPYTYEGLFAGGISPASTLPAGEHDHNHVTLRRWPFSPGPSSPGHHHCAWPDSPDWGSGDRALLQSSAHADTSARPALGVPRGAVR